MSTFEGKVVVVTGGASGIGAGTSKMFAAQGAKVAVVDVNAPAAGEIAAAIAADGGTAKAFECDVADDAAAERMIGEVVAAFGQVDVLFNNAGIAPRASIEEMSVADWRRVMAVDLDSVFYVSKAALPHLRKTRGCIVNTGSQCSIAGYPRLAAYTAAKAGLLMLSKQMAVELKGAGIRVNTVLPGVVVTPMAMRAWKEEGKDVESMDLSKFQTPEDIGRAVLFLADPANQQVSGNAIVVNGVHGFI